MVSTIVICQLVQNLTRGLTTTHTHMRMRINFCFYEIYMEYKTTCFKDLMSVICISGLIGKAHPTETASHHVVCGQ